MYIKFKSAYKKADKVGYVILSVVLNYSSTQHTRINVTPYFDFDKSDKSKDFISSLQPRWLWAFFVFCATRTQEV